MGANLTKEEKRMALRQCPDCNASISRSAASCPTCGHVPGVIRTRKFFYVVAACSYAAMTLAITNPGDAMFYKVGLFGLLISSIAISLLMVW